MTPQSLSRAARGTVVALALATLIPAASLTTGCFVDRRQIADTQRTDAFDLFTQGQELERRGDLTRAIDYYARAAELSPRPAFYASAGNAHAQLGQHTQAIHFYDLALGLNPDFDTARAERDLSVLALEREAEFLPPATTRLEVADVLIDPATEPIAVDEQGTLTLPKPQPEEPVVSEVPAPEAPAAPAEPAPVWETPAAPEPAVAAPVAPTPEPAAPVVAAPAAPEAPAMPAVPSFAYEEPMAVDLGLLDLPVINPGDLPPRRVRAAGEDTDRERLRAALFSHVSTGNPDDFAAEREAAQAAFSAQRWDEATRRWERLSNQHPEDMEARLRLADSLQRSGRSVRAWDVFAQAARLDPENPTVHREWGNSLVRAGELEKAAESYGATLRLVPDLVEVRNNLAAIDIERGRAPQAVRDLEALLAQRPDFAPAWLNLAIAVERAGGDKSRQIAALESYLRLDGARDAEAERWLVELRSGR